LHANFRRSWRVLPVAVLALFLTGRASAAVLHIAAAANLQKVLTQALIPAFQKQTGATVVPTFASTKLLATQVENGAPVDVFVSADTATTDKLAAQGLLVPRSVRVYAIGRLVLWTRADAAHHPRRIQDLSSPVYAKIAVANPTLAPYGLAAQQSFAHVGLTASVTPRLAVAENIGQALQYAQSGNAAVALTALSLVIEDHADPYVLVPDNLHAPIAQSEGVVKTSAQPALAARFASFLASPATAPVWKHFGYELPHRSR
jgi:molybdate transport system substrate-binding protein